MSKVMVEIQDGRSTKEAELLALRKEVGALKSRVRQLEMEADSLTKNAEIMERRWTDAEARYWELTKSLGWGGKLDAESIESKIAGWAMAQGRRLTNTGEEIIIED